MVAYTSQTAVAEQAAFAPPPVIVSGSNEAAIERASRTVTASGMRIADRVLVADTVDRLRQQISLSAVWLELDGEEAAGTDALLGEINALAADRGCQAIVAAPLHMVDILAARIDSPDVEIVIGGDDSERAAALAVAMARAGMPLRLSDAASDRNAERLRQLSDEVGRIASTLARLSTGPSAPAKAVEMPASESPDVSADTVRSVIRARRLRSRFFPEDLFADPAWDMLLDLLQAEIAQLRVPVSSLCIAASVPATTALRWLKSMTEQGLFLRRADPHDGRRVFVELAPQASSALRRYFVEVGKAAVI